MFEMCILLYIIILQWNIDIALPLLIPIAQTLHFINSKTCAKYCVFIAVNDDTALCDNVCQ
jgi:hypothetical protein